MLKTVAAALVVVAVPTVAFAQEVVYTPGFDPEQLSVSADPASIALQDGARPLGKKDYAAGLVLHVGGPPLDVCVIDEEDPSSGCEVEDDILNTRLRADLQAIYGFGRFDVRAILPMVLYQSSDFGPGEGMEQLGSTGVGDLRLGGRFGILETSGVGLAADLSFTLPTGGGDDFIGDSGLLVDPRILADWRKDKIGVAASLGYRYRQEAARLANLYVDDEITWSLGGEYQIQPDKFSAGLALYGHIGVMSDPDPMEGVEAALGGEERPAEVLASGRYFVTDKIAIEFGAGTALTSGYGTAPFRVLAGVRWIDVTRDDGPALPRDTDGDGIVDPDDQCVREKEDVDGHEDLDGCPDKDDDGDGVLDASDECPAAPEDRDAFQDDDGCPDLDDDGDGIADTADACRLDAEDKNGVDDEDGCPEKDSDGDGLLDPKDGCPAEPEDLDGFQDDDGCPDTDNDGDGLLDTQDQCPNEAEIFNDQVDDDGCPDDGRTIATVTSSAIVINDKVFFDVDRARIKRRSYSILNAVAAVLQAHEHLRVRIEGHTDDQGKADWNKDLSQRRAEAVRDYLVGKGVDTSRLEPVGYGFERPLVEGKTEKARSKNRRVEFVIIQDNADGAAPAPAPESAPESAPSDGQP
jgi:outer membrane protein OmpA-like peptidoglycan-associated protein